MSDNETQGPPEGTETDSAAPTDAVSDEVKTDAVKDQLDEDDFPDRPAQTHP